MTNSTPVTDADADELLDVIRVVPGLITIKPREPSLGVAFALLSLAVTVGTGIAWLIR